MSLFPDDNRRKQDDLVGDDDRPVKDYPEPTPNPPHAFEGGTIREGGVSSGGSGRRNKPAREDGTIRRNKPDGGAKKNKEPNLKKDLKLNTRGNKAGAIFVSLLIGGGILFGCAMVFIFVIGPMFGLFNPFGENTREVPGDATAFDPIAVYDEIALYAQGEASELMFTGMSAYYVKSDGTLDLTVESYLARVEWEFYVTAERPEDAPPVGAGGSPNDRYFQTVEVNAFRPGQFRTVSTTSGGSRSTYSYRHLGLERDYGSPTITHGDALPAPTCSFATLWDTAIERGAPADAVAIITYDDDGYYFRIQDTDFRFDFNRSCRIVG